MTYGASKERDMVRSILPSTSRKAARDNKQNVNRAHRSAVRQALRQHRDVLAVEGWDDGDDDALDAPYVKVHEADRTYDRKIKDSMWMRREADKVAPIIRWAEKKVQDIRPEDRLSWLQARMPNNLAVRHAISHIKYSDAFPDENPYEYGWRQYYRMTDEERAWVAAAEYAQGLVDLYKICTGPITRFNNLLPKHAYREIYIHRYRKGERPKLPAPWVLKSPSPYDSGHYDRYTAPIERLYGVHDIEDFIQRLIDLVGVGEARRIIDRAIEMTYLKDQGTYFSFHEKSRFHNKR